MNFRETSEREERIKKKREVLERKRKQKITRFIMIILAAILLIVVLILAIKGLVDKDSDKVSKKAKKSVEVQTTGVVEEETTEDPNAAPKDVDSYVDIATDPELAAKIFGKHIAVIDVTDNTLIAGKSPDERIYPASMTKVMTLIVAVEHIQSLDQTVVLEQEDIGHLYAEDASCAGFKVGEPITAKDLLYGLALPSGADAAIGLAKMCAGSQEAFVQMMNDKCTELGLTNTHFANPTGLHDENLYTTAREMAMIMRYAMRNETCKEVLSTYQYTAAAKNDYYPDGIVLTSTLFSRIYGDREIPGVTIVAGKTGYTQEAMHCLVTYATSGGKEYVICDAGAEGTYWNTIWDNMRLYARFGAGYTGEGVVLSSGEVIVPPAK